MIFRPCTNDDLIRRLDTILIGTLAAINQYFLHARILKHTDFMLLADHAYKESINQMRYADQLVDRILHLGGRPNLQAIGNLIIGEDTEAMLHGDLTLIKYIHDELEHAIILCKQKEDHTTASLLESIHKNQQEHKLFLQMHIKLLHTADACLS